MLKKDFNGYAEFTKKIKETSGEERDEVCMERTQMWTDKFMNLINPLPWGGFSVCDYILREHSGSTPQR